jgi:hypothetical protein
MKSKYGQSKSSLSDAGTCTLRIAGRARHFLLEQLLECTMNGLGPPQVRLYTFLGIHLSSSMTRLVRLFSVRHSEP